ncbi:hypothetical protein [Microvirga vignae]|uniref:hypothetical protein n=1 Tax=Microvirga vignae TaxID=1225564 RepID=UPI00136494CD|nr:hypothetical protein [Microvirga vignae]
MLVESSKVTAGGVSAAKRPAFFKKLRLDSSSTGKFVLGERSGSSTMYSSRAGLSDGNETPTKKL